MMGIGGSLHRHRVELSALRGVQVVDVEAALLGGVEAVEGVAGPQALPLQQVPHPGHRGPELQRRQVAFESTPCWRGLS